MGQTTSGCRLPDRGEQGHSRKAEHPGRRAAPAGLVTSEPDPGDRRKTLITAIGKGRQLSATIPAAREAWLSSAIGTLLDADEQQMLLKAAAIINRIADSHP